MAVRLWPAIPAGLLESCPLLPPLQRPLTAGSRGLLVTEAYSAAPEAAAAAEALFSRAHLLRLLPVLRASTASHPRLHLLWPTLLALLMPGFSPRSVSALSAEPAAPIACGAGGPASPAILNAWPPACWGQV